MIVVNCKTYLETCGENAVILLQICETVAKQCDIPIILCPNTFDVKDFANRSEIPIFAQHLDAIEPGAHTGTLPMKLAKENRIAGTLLNHAEHRLALNLLLQSISMAKENQLETIVCVQNLQEAMDVASAHPDYIALEIPSLIAGAQSIAQVSPEEIQHIVTSVAPIPVLAGAGIKSVQDIQIIQKRGAKGVILSSGVDLSQNPQEELLKLAQSFTS